MSTPEEFSAEQLVVIEVLRLRGVPRPENLVRADRVGAALLGAHLAPILQRMALVVAGAVSSLAAAMEPSRRPS